MFVLVFVFLLSYNWIGPFGIPFAHLSHCDLCNTWPDGECNKNYVNI